MKANKWKPIIASALGAVLLGACAVQPGTKTAPAPIQESTVSSPDSAVQPLPDTTPAADGTSRQSSALTRPALLDTSDSAASLQITPCVEAYTVDADLGNIDNLWQFYLPDTMTEKLAQNHFVVWNNAGKEFYVIYEMNRYGQLPSFVTVDSLMHTYHLYFSHLLKNIERDYLTDMLAKLGRQMLAESAAQYDRLKGSEWENAAKRNTAFFAVGAKLLDDGIAIPAYASEAALTELEKIRLHDGIHPCGLTDSFEDYSQYTPRGYYEGDAKLTAYFQAMMWYGRIHFAQEKEDLDRSALLLTLALSQNPDCQKTWEALYAVTSFFAGASDDLGVCEYEPLLHEAYGDSPALDSLPGNPEAFARFRALAAALPLPQIHSVPVMDGENPVIPGLRFLGQRFTIDAAIMQRLIYSNTKQNDAGQNRMLPDVLDVPAALGSDAALQILTEAGATDYAGYTENMTLLRDALSKENQALWSASLYAGWLHTLRPLLQSKGEGYPVFMQSREWDKKNLECFAGSYTELKHDTVLYAKQVIAEMGGGWEEEPDDRGYVEPEPQVYARFAALSDQTAQGLSHYGLLAPADAENLTRLSRIASTLLAISQKELQDETLTDQEYEFIKSYGGSIEHFWYETVKDQTDSEYISTQEFPAALVVDIATDPNGTVLEAATGDPSQIYVIVKVDGKLKLARGSAYSFYQFPWPLSDRLTDIRWRQMMGLQADDGGNYVTDPPIAKPEWTASYRYYYE